MNDIFLLQSGFATLALEFLKWLLYVPVQKALQLIFKNPALVINIPVEFYLVALPVLNLLAVPVLALTGFGGFTMPTDAVEFFREVLRLVIQSLISVFIYNGGLKPTNAALNRD